MKILVERSSKPSTCSQGETIKPQQARLSIYGNKESKFICLPHLLEMIEVDLGYKIEVKPV